MESRVFMIFYSLIGIPINGIVLGIMGDFFAKTVSDAINGVNNTADNACFL